MKKLVFTFLTVMALAVVLTATIADPVSAAPAKPHHGQGCFVQDANFVQYLDPDCEWHEVDQYDEAGNFIGVLNYQDHGHLPPGAALPAQTMVSIFHVDCSCPYDGDYRQVLMPNGAYHSQGPMFKNK